MNVNPTRMELKRLKNRLKTAERGHKLLKDKTDEMVRQFIIYARQNKELREEVEYELGEAMKNFVLARALMTPEAVEEAILMPSRSVSLSCAKKSVMSVVVPSIEINESDQSDLYPYSFISVTDQMDSSIETLNKLLVKLSEAREYDLEIKENVDFKNISKKAIKELEFKVKNAISDGVQLMREHKCDLAEVYTKLNNTNPSKWQEFQENNYY